MKSSNKSYYNKFSYFLIIIFIIGVFPSIYQSISQNQISNNDNYSNNIKDKEDDLAINDSSEFFNGNNDLDLTANRKISVSSLNPGFGDRVWEFCRTCFKNVTIYQIKFSPNMKLLAAGTYSGKILIFDVLNGFQLYRLDNSVEKIESLVWSKDSKILVSLFKDSILNYWNMENGTLEKQINFASRISGIRNFIISNDGAKLVIASSDGKISLWSFEGKFLSYIMNDSKSYLIDLKFSSNDMLLAIVSSVGKVWVWSLDPLKLKLNSSITLDPIFGYQFFRGNGIDFSPHNDLLFVSLDTTRRIITFDLLTGTKVSNSIPIVNSIGIDYAAINSLTQDKNKPIIAYAFVVCDGCGRDHTFVYDYSKNKTLLELDGGLTVEFSKDGSMLAVLTGEELITVYNTIQNSEIVTLSGHNNIAKATKFLNGSIFVSADSESVKIWQNDKLLRSIEDPRISNICGITGSLDITENSKKDILVSFEGYFNNIPGYIFIYNLTDDFLNIYSNNGVNVELTNFSPNSSLLVSTDDTKIKIWNVNPFVLINEINLPLEGGNTISKGFQFISNTEIIGSSGSTSKIFKWDINGTLINTYNLDIEPGVFGSFIIALHLSADKTILGMEVANGYLAYLNLTSGEYHSKQLLDFITSASLAEFSDVIVTPGNRYIVGIAGGIHSLFIAEIKDLSLKAIFPLDIGGILRVGFNSKSWTIAIGKSDYKVGLFDLSYLRDDKMDSFDFDCDGMNDTWENTHDLDSGKYWDRFEDPDQDNVVNWEESLHHTNPQSKDTDNDTITDTYEIEYGLNPNVDDSLLDIDGDGMNNLYEFKMGLDSSINDSYWDYDQDGLTNLQEFQHQTDVHNPDTDFDGMPDKWEIDNSLNPINPADASKDNDLDGISNLEEYRMGSDPNNFISVPLFSVNNFYFLILLVASIMSGIGFVEYRRTITNRFLAPDYASARKVKHAGLDSWYDYGLKEAEIEKQLKKSKSLLFEGLVDQSLSLYYSIADMLRNLGKDTETAETLVRLLFIHQKLHKSNPVDFKLVSSKFPSKSRNTLIKNYRNILNAYEYESNNNAGLALNLLNGVYFSNILPPEFSLITFYSVLDLSIEQTQLDKSTQFFKEIEVKLNDFRKQAEKLKMFEFVCGAYLLTARLYFYKYKLDEATNYIDKVTATAKNRHIYYFIQKASMEVQSFTELKDTIKSSLSLTDETVLTLERNFEEYQKQIYDYTTQAKQILEHEDD